MRESKFQTVLRVKLTKAGAMVFNVHGHAMQEPGWPDLQVYSPMWTGHLELKVGRGTLSVQQRLKIKHLRLRLFPAWVLREDGSLWDHDDVCAGKIDLLSDGVQIMDQLRRYSDSAGLLTSSYLRRIGKPRLKVEPFKCPPKPTN